MGRIKETLDPESPEVLWFRCEVCLEVLRDEAMGTRPTLCQYCEEEIP